MRIVYVITRADAVGGASIHVRDLALAMRARGHEACVLVGGSGAVTDEFERAGVPFQSLGFLARAINPLRDLRALKELTAALAQLRPDLVSTHTAKAGWIGRAACARLGLPVLYTPHGWSIGNRVSPALGGAFTAAERIAAGWTHAIICVCEAEKQLALRKRIAPPEKLFVVHNGVRDVPDELRACPERHPVRICSVARFQAPKDHATLLHALGKLRGEPWELDLIGDGPLEPRMRRLAEELGIGSRVHFLGYQPDPARVLASAQLSVLSSRSEGFPRSVLEAMRAGLPVIASDIGGIAEAVKQGENGVLVPASSAEALASAVRELLVNPARRRALGDAARLTFEKQFRIECMVEKTAGIYASLLAGR